MFTKRVFTRILDVPVYIGFWAVLLISALTYGDSLPLTTSEPGTIVNKSAVNLAFVGTKAYKERISSFRLCLDEARERSLRFQRRQKKTAFRGQHYFVVDDEYVFSFPPLKMGIPLTGFYVNGKTGKVRRVKEKDVKKVFGDRFKTYYIPTRQAIKMGYKVCPCHQEGKTIRAKGGSSPNED